MKRFLYIIIFFSNSLFSDYYSLISKPLVQNNIHLSISINSNCNSQYVNYAIIKESNGKILKKNLIGELNTLMT